MGWTMRALVWRFTKLFEKWGDHHHRSGEEEPLVERRKEGLALSIKEESESFVTFYQERKWKFCHDNCLSCWVLIVSAWHGLVAKVLAINVQNLVSLLKQLRPGVIIIIKITVWGKNNPSALDTPVEDCTNMYSQYVEHTYEHTIYIQTVFDTLFSPQNIIGSNLRKHIVGSILPFWYSFWIGKDYFCFR